MKLLALALIASVQATDDCAECTKQDCSSAGWICCGVLKADEEPGSSSGKTVCTDPNTRGIVPTEIPIYGGGSYHCTHDQHKEYAAGSADASSYLTLGFASAALISASLF